MKISDLQIVRKLTSRFKPILLGSLTFLFCLARMQAQVSKTYVQELEVDENTTVVSNVPTRIDKHTHGTMTCNNTYDHYSIHGKNGETRLNINKELNIETWDKHVVRQEVYIAVKAESEAIAQEVLDAIKIKLKKGSDNRVKIDCNLNITKFKMENGFFKADECHIFLNNGKRYPIESLEIECNVSIPKTVNLEVIGYENATLRIGELEGDLDLDLTKAEVYGTKVRRLKGNLKSCYNVIFDTVASASISASNSYVKIENLGGISIGAERLQPACDLPNAYSRKTHSYQTKYSFGTVGHLDIHGSANDEFVAKEIGALNVKSARFTSFTFDRLNVSMDLTAKNSDISIGLIAKDFLEINLNNSFSEISFVVEEGANYELNLDRKKYLECNLDSKYIRMDNTDGIQEKYTVGNGKSESVINVNCDRCQLDIKN